MKRYNWPQTLEAIQTAPDLEKLSYGIAMVGCFDTFVPRGQKLPERWYETTAEIEKSFRRAYPGLEIVGEENENQFCSEYPGLRYLGNIYARDTKSIIARLSMHGTELKPEFPINALMELSAVFSLEGRFHDCAANLLKQIWPYIKGFNLTFPSRDLKYPKNKQGNSTVALIRDDQTIASGQYAFDDAHLGLEPKEPLFACRGILI